MKMAQKIEHNSDENSNIGDKKNYNYKLKKTRHDKPVDNLAKLYFNSDTETEKSKEGETKTSIKHDVQDDEMISFDKTKVKLLQRLRFQSKSIKFVLSCIPHFEE